MLLDGRRVSAAYLLTTIGTSGVFTIGPLRPWPPLQKNATKMPHFQAKISKIFWGGGTAPSPDPTPTGEGNTPDHTPHPRRSSPRPSPNFFPISIITLDSHAVIDEFGKSNRLLVLLLDLGLLNGTR